MRVPVLCALALFGSLVASCDNRTLVEQATEERILIIGNSNEPKGLDPHLVSGVLESNLLRALFEGLAVDHPSKDGLSEKGEGGAVDWEANEEFTVWTFKLNPLGKWSDGMPVTAHDYVFSYRRMLDPAFPAKYAEMLYYIKGAEEYNKGKNPDPESLEARAIDDFTLEITLRGPIPFLPEITKHYTWYPVPRHVILKHGEMNEPFTEWTRPGNLVSNGPFQLKSWRVTHSIEVERNPHYWDAANVKLNGIRFMPISNYYTETRMFLDGLLHITYSVPSEMIPYAKEKLPTLLRQEPYVGTRFIRCNTRVKPFDDPRVTHALAAAIDRKTFIENILQGGQVPAYGITPPFRGYETPEVVGFDPEKARRLLAEAGYPDGNGFPEVKFLTTDRDGARRNAETFQAMLQENLGINLRIEQREWTTYLQDQYDGNYELCDGGWIGDFLDPTTFLDMWTEGNGNNNTGWASKEFETALRRAENTADPDMRFKILVEAENILLRDLPVIPIYWYTTNYLIRPEVQGWNPLLLNNHPYKYVDLIPPRSKR